MIPGPLPKRKHYGPGKWPMGDKDSENDPIPKIPTTDMLIAGVVVEILCDKKTTMSEQENVGKPCVMRIFTGQFSQSQKEKANEIISLHQMYFAYGRDYDYLAFCSHGRR